MTKKKDNVKKSIGWHIRHFIGKFFVTILILILIIIGFSQTYTFRSLLRDQILSIAKEELNGEIKIGKIEGSLFSSISLADVEYNIDGVRFIKADLISLNFSLLGLISKNISINEIKLINPEINLFRFPDSTWIFERIVKKVKPPDTTVSSPFDYTIILRNFTIENCNFRLKNLTNEKIGLEVISSRFFNTDDLYIKGLNVRIQALANFAQKKLNLKIRNISFDSNIEDFELKKLALNINLNEKGIDLQNIQLTTVNSDIRLRASVKDFNLFKSIDMEKLKETQVSLDLKLNPFNFRDLNILVPDINMLVGNIFAELNVDEKINDLNINKFNLRFGNSKLFLKGNVKNINSPESMWIKSNFSDCEVDLKDVINLLPLYKLNFLQEFGILKIKALTFEGEPTKFNSEIDLHSDVGGIKSNVKMDLKARIPTYDVSVTTNDFNLRSIAKMNTVLNSKIHVVGEGFKIDQLNTRLNADFIESRFQNIKIDSLTCDFTAKNKIMELNIAFASDTSSINIEGILNNTIDTIPKFDVSIFTDHIDLEKLFGIKDYNSDLNTYISLDGESFDLDQMALKLDINFLESYLKNSKLPLTKISTKLDTKDITNKSFTFNSDVIDLQINGDFVLTDMIKDIPKRIDKITASINRKLKAFQSTIPDVDTIDNIVQIKTIKKKTKDIKIEKDFIPEYNLDYSVNFKDFSLLTLFLRDQKLEIDGNIKGKLSNDAENFNLTFNNKVNNLWLISKDEYIRLKNASIDLDINEKFIQKDSGIFSGKIALNAEKIYNSTIINNLVSRLSVNKDSILYNISLGIDTTIKAISAGVIDISKPTYDVRLNRMTLEYNKYKITNEGILNFSFSREGINFEKFRLRRKNERINISGFVGFTGDQNLKLSANKISVSDIFKNFYEDYPNKIDGLITLNANITGNADDPVIESSFMVDSNVVNTNAVGSLIGQMFYEDKKLGVEVHYLDKMFQGQDMYLEAHIPINLAFAGVKERINKNDSISAQINLDHFNLVPLQAFVLELKNASGVINGGIDVSGTMNHPVIMGKLKVDSALMTIAHTNLTYIANSEISINDENITLDKLSISNYNMKENHGTLLASGKLVLKDFDLKDIDINVTGNLLVLAEESKKVNQQVYGNLFLEIEKPINLKGSDDYVRLTGNILVKKASLTIPFAESQYSRDESTFRYIIKRNPNEEQVDSTELAFQNAIKGTSKREVPEKSSTEKPKGMFSNFISDLKVKMSDDVSLQFILSKELNQRLYTELNGELVFKLIDNQIYFQGEIRVTPESYLVFYQRFNASGTLRFEREISNPSLDILAKYSNYYTGNDTTGSKVKDVTVNIKLKGTVKELAKNLVQNPENLTVEIDGQVDPSKDASDIIAFVILGKFKNDLTAQDKSNVSGSLSSTIQGAATSLLGSLVSSFANQVLGDVIRSVDLQQVGGQTVFSLSGRVERLRFKFGGKTTALQNLSTADIQLEYPLFEKLFLRIERKNASFRTDAEIEMINEIALKYKYEF